MTTQPVQPILPPATLGILGGGQLGRFFVSAAHEMGYQVWVLDPDPNSPAGRIADRHLAANYDDQDALNTLASSCAAITTEFENVPAETLHQLAQQTHVHPSASAVAVCQNRIAEKGFLSQHGFPHGPYAAIHSEAELQTIDIALFPAILKVARFGYDGKGQAHISNREEALAAFRAFHQEPCVLEKKLSLDSELSVVLARDQAGNVRSYPAGKNTHHNGILDITIAPAPLAAPLAEQAREIAAQIAEKLGYIGTLGVEFFVCNQQLHVNEMAPRPHNSGHHTLDANITSQYEQQVRALCGLPLGETAPHSHAIMVNLLGDLWFENGQPTGTYREPDWTKLHAIPNLKLHLYGKHEARPGRKMGHFTLIGSDLKALEQAAKTARAAIGIHREV